MKKETRTKKLSLRLSEAEFKNMEQITKKEKISKSTFVRLSLASAFSK